MGAVTRKQIEELQELDESDPVWFAGILADITNGDSNDLAFAKVCKDYEVSWGALRNWIKADDVRERKYQGALEARRELRQERVAANVMEIASVRHVEVKASDTLRAAEIVLDSGVSERGAAVSITIIHESA